MDEDEENEGFDTSAVSVPKKTNHPFHFCRVILKFFLSFFTGFYDDSSKVAWALEDWEAWVEWRDWEVSPKIISFCSFLRLDLL